MSGAIDQRNVLLVCFLTYLEPLTPLIAIIAELEFYGANGVAQQQLIVAFLVDQSLM